MPQARAPHRARWRAAIHDPGLAQLRIGTAAAVALGVTLLAEYLCASSVRPELTLMAMLFGGISAMQTSGALMQPRWQSRLVMTGWQALFTSASIALDVAARELGGRWWEMALLVPVTFCAVFMRRLGPQFVTVGLVTWAAYYMAVFLEPSWADLPFLVGAEALAAVVGFVLSMTVWGHRPRLALRHATTTWNRLIDAVLADSMALVGETSLRSIARRRRRLRSNAGRLTGTALTLEGWLANIGQSPGWNPTAIRRRLIEEHLAVETIAGAAISMPAGPPPPELSAIMDRAVEDLAELRRGWQRPSPDDVHGRPFAAATPLGPGGALPGPARFAGNVASRGRQTHRLSVSTRQAIQATVAMAVTMPIGYLVSSVHYSWALIAVFMVFLGTTTRGDALVKATHRFAGTIIGLLLSVPFTWLVGDRPLAIIALALIACFVGHYLMSVGYVYLMLCLTIVIPQMYDLMNALNVQLLELRALETLLGALIAVAISMLITPIRTRDTARQVRLNLLTAVADFLTEAADRVEHGGAIGIDELRLFAREIDDHARLLVLAARPLTWRRSRRALQAELHLYNTCARDIHRLTQWLASDDDARQGATVVALRALASATRELVEPSGRPQPASPESSGSNLVGNESLASRHPLVGIRETLDALGRSS